MTKKGGLPIDRQAAAGCCQHPTRRAYLLFLALLFPPAFVMIGGQ